MIFAFACHKTMAIAGNNKTNDYNKNNNTVTVTVTVTVTAVATITMTMTMIKYYWKEF